MLKEYFKRWVPVVDEKLEELLEVNDNYGFINKVALQFRKEFVLSPGKRVRPVLVVAGYENTGKEVDSYVIDVAAAVEMFHAFLLIHDDFMDRDEMRRGLPTVWKRFEEIVRDRHLSYSLAVTTGDILYAEVYRTILKSDVPRKEEILHLLSDVTIKTGFGQNLDLYLSSQPLDKVNEEDVIKMYELKTGIYTLSFPLQLGSLLGGEDGSNLYEFGRLTGIAFQIHDDIIGTFGDPHVTGKPTGSDIREGKRSYLIVKAFKNSSPTERELLLRALGSEDEKLIEEAKNIIKERALDDVNREKKELVERALKYVEGERFYPFFEELAYYLISREK